MPEEIKKTEDLIDVGETVGAEVELNEEKVTTVIEEPIVEEIKETSEDKSFEKEKTEEPKEEIEDYSEGVKKRISKLTKKWREAERQREAALEFAKGGQVELQQLKAKVSKLEPGYVNAMEGKLKNGLESAKSQLLRAREAGDIDSEVEAQKEISRIGVEESKVSTLKN